MGSSGLKLEEGPTFSVRTVFTGWKLYFYNSFPTIIIGKTEILLYSITSKLAHNMSR